MGHIRLGRLPKTKQWSRIFHVLESSAISPEKLARAVATGAYREFSSLRADPSINYCFWILVRITTAARTDDFAGELSRLGIQDSGITSGLSFVQQVGLTVQKEIRKRGLQNVLVPMAKLTLLEVLSTNIVEQSRSLFGTGLDEIQTACRAMSSTNRFGQVAKEFFAHLMSRSIRYIVDKEISNYVGRDRSIKSAGEVLVFYKDLDRYCNESAKIVEEFAAGWFSKHNWESNSNISENATAAFTAYAFTKIQMDLQQSQI